MAYTPGQLNVLRKAEAILYAVSWPRDVSNYSTFLALNAIVPTPHSETGSFETRDYTGDELETLDHALGIINNSRVNTPEDWAAWRELEAHLRAVGFTPTFTPFREEPEPTPKPPVLDSLQPSSRGTKLPAWCALCKSWCYIEDIWSHVGGYHGVAAVEVHPVDLRTDERLGELLNFTRNSNVSITARDRIKRQLVDGEKPKNELGGDSLTPDEYSGLGALFG